MLSSPMRSAARSRARKTYELLSRFRFELRGVRGHPRLERRLGGADRRLLGADRLADRLERARSHRANPGAACNPFPGRVLDFEHAPVGRIRPPGFHALSTGYPPAAHLSTSL